MRLLPPPPCAVPLTSRDTSCFRAFTRARFGLLVQSVQSGGACEHAGMQQGDVIIGVGSTLLDSTMPCVCPANHKRCVPRGVILFLFIRYDACLGLIKSACKKADEDFDDPYIVRFANLHRFIVCPISVLFPFGLFFTGPHGLSSSRQSSVCPHREFRRCRKKQQQRSLHLIRRPVRVSQQCRPSRVTH